MKHILHLLSYGERWLLMSSKWGFWLHVRFQRVFGWGVGQCNIPQAVLYIDSGMACASSSLIDYVRKWNPELYIPDHCHSPGAMKWVTCPVVVITDNMHRQIERRRKRHCGEWSRWLEELIIRKFFRTCPWDRVITVQMEQVIKDPAGIVAYLRTRTGLPLNVGDGRLPRSNPFTHAFIE